MKRKYLGALIGFAVIIVCLVITNPSRSTFRDYLGFSTKLEEITVIRREKNFLICSIHSWGYINGKKEGKYLGIVGNFFLLSN